MIKIGQVYLNKSFKLAFVNLKIRILMQKRIKISKEGCTVSAVLITSEILSSKILSLLVYWSCSPEKIIKQTLLKLFTLLLFKVDSLEKNDPDKVTYYKYSPNKSAYLSHSQTKLIIFDQYFKVDFDYEKKLSLLNISKIGFLNSFINIFGDL